MKNVKLLSFLDYIMCKKLTFLALMMVSTPRGDLLCPP